MINTITRGLLRKIYATLIGLVISLMGFSQTCLPEGISFTTQTQIDSFQINYPNCTEIEGDVLINGSDISNLNGLSSLTSIMGALSIGAFPESNNSLNSLTGLDGLTYIGGDIRIVYNNDLESLTGLDNISSIGWGLWILSNDSLSSLIGLQGLTSFGGDLLIEQNHCLSSLTGMDNVASIGGMIRIQNNLSLTSLIGLNGLITIGGNLQVLESESLVSLTGLENLTSIQGNLSIYFNDALTSLIALNNIDAGSIDNLQIAENLSLSTCDAKSICDYLANPYGIVEIDHNATGCDSQEEVKAACKAGIDDNATPESQITIYPNLSSTTITISLPSTTPVNNTTLSINNVNSQQVISHRITGPLTVIDIFTLPRGVYFARITTDAKVMVGKFIKQ